MSKELSPKYNPAEVEAGRYQKWLDEDVFKPSGDKKGMPSSRASKAPGTSPPRLTAIMPFHCSTGSRRLASLRA